MVEGLDSDHPPTAAQVQQAKQAGYSIWSGYIATRPDPANPTASRFNLDRPWTKAEFDVVRALNPQPIAYCSGWDDPVALKALASEWSVRLCLDVESGIRGDGSWVQAFLDASGAGLYGNSQVHTGRRAPFHVWAGYPASDPGTSWPAAAARPATPCGWQWHGTESLFGMAVDLTHFDDWFGGEMLEATDPIVKAIQQSLAEIHGATVENDYGALGNLRPEIDAIRDAVQNGVTILPQNVQDALTKIAAHLQ